MSRPIRRGKPTPSSLALTTKRARGYNRRQMRPAASPAANGVAHEAGHTAQQSLSLSEVVHDGSPDVKSEAIVLSARALGVLYSSAHAHMRNIDGLQPQEAFDELLKYLFFKQMNEEGGSPNTVPQHVRGNGSRADDVQRIAEGIRRLFRQHLAAANGWSAEMWRDRAFHLSDDALAAIHQLLGDVAFGNLPFDTRGAALREFVTPEIRRGLGIYLTPDAVAEAAVAVTAPSIKDRVYDPACGSATFLIETVKHWVKTGGRQKQFAVFGSDKSARMLLIAELNLGHSRPIRFHHQVMDAFAPHPTAAWPAPDSFDLILTNPPFGVIVDCDAMKLSTLDTAKAPDGELRRRQASEVLFVEQCLRWLRPAGRLAIVIPRSLVTNAGLADARNAIGRLGYVEGVLALPPETFSATGTQTTVFVLFFRKYRVADEETDPISTAVVDVENVGHDQTGRPRAGNELPQAASDLREAISTGRPSGLAKMLPGVPKRESLSRLGSLLAAPQAALGRSRQMLGDFVTLADTGRTPARAAYSDSGLFILKVGNLTGRGIDWAPRDRNFVAEREAASRANGRLLLVPGDLVMTSSAHSPKYIAKKVDIISSVPEYVGGKTTFCGEVLRLRIKPGVMDPYLLLAYLRSETAMLRLQRMIRGQTAHLMPRDVMELSVPPALFDPPKALIALRELLLKQAEAALHLDALVRREEDLLAELVGAYSV